MRKFCILQTMELEKCNQGRAERNKILTFILFVTDSLARPKGYDLGIYVREEGL